MVMAESYQVYITETAVHLVTVRVKYDINETISSYIPQFSGL